MILNNIHDPDVKEVFETLEEAFMHLEIDYYLIGAFAREVWYTTRTHSIHSRRTKDIDFAVLVGSLQEYEALQSYLTKHYNFQTIKANAFVMLAPNQIQIDMLPFGEIASESIVAIDGLGLTSINVDGFLEVYQNGTKQLGLESGNLFKVASLSSIVLLKFISFEDRPEMRLKDARDIANIINHFFDLESELIYSEAHVEIFREEAVLESMSLQEISSIVIGRSIRSVIISNEVLFNRIDNFLNVQIIEADSSAFIRNMSVEVNLSIAEMIKWLKSILQGLTGT